MFTDEINYLIGTGETIERICNIDPLSVFDSRVVEFLDALSKSLIKNSKYPECVAFSFWCREANILSYKKKYSHINLFGKGNVFHITPANVPGFFAYSLAAGMLAGNNNIIRISNNAEKTDIAIIEEIKKLLEGSFNEFRNRIAIIQYEHNKQITDTLSLLADTRVIWGGDDTINTIRMSPIKPNTADIVFADRFSLCIINSDKYIECTDKKRFAERFYNDAFLFNQKACSSPKLVIWKGNNIDQSKAIFWDELYQLTAKRDAIDTMDIILKLKSSYMLAALFEGKIIKGYDQRIVRVEIDTIKDGLTEYLSSGGFFIELKIKSLEEIIPICNKKLQTITYYGISKDEFFNTSIPGRADRIVPVGRAMSFSLVWDGYDMIRSLSKEISFEEE